MKETLKALVTSKKFISAVVGIAAVAGVRYLGLEEAQATELSRQIVGIVALLLVGQGMSDLGKEARINEALGIENAIVTQAAVAEGFTEALEDDGDEAL